jgi:hypothetical protein
MLNSVKVKAGVHGRNLIHKLMSFGVDEKFNVFLSLAACMSTV